MAELGTHDEVILGAGVLTVGTEPVGVMQSVELNYAGTIIKLQGSYTVPVAVAAGPGTFKATFKAGSLNLTALGVVLGLSGGYFGGVAIGSVTPGTVTWAAPVFKSGGSNTGKTATFTFEAVAYEGWKYSSGNTKFGEQDISFECAPDASGHLFQVAIA